MKVLQLHTFQGGKIDYAQVIAEKSSGVGQFDSKKVKTIINLTDYNQPTKKLCLCKCRKNIQILILELGNISKYVL